MKTEAAIMKKNRQFRGKLKNKEPNIDPRRASIIFSKLQLVSNVPFLYSLKTSGNLWLSVFRGIKIELTYLLGPSANPSSHNNF